MISIRLLLTKMAIGNNRQIVMINGRTRATSLIPNPSPPPTYLPIPPVTKPGGLLTTPTNIGRYAHDQFTVLPQLGVELGCAVGDHLRLFAGYDLIYWPHVQRAANQVDMAVDPRNLPFAPSGETGTIFPAPRLVSDDFWAQA
jgi:hypothetical protein